MKQYMNLKRKKNEIKKKVITQETHLIMKIRFFIKIPALRKINIELLTFKETRKNVYNLFSKKQICRIHIKN